MTARDRLKLVLYLTLDGNSATAEERADAIAATPTGAALLNDADAAPALRAALEEVRDAYPVVGETHAAFGRRLQAIASAALEAQPAPASQRVWHQHLERGCECSRRPDCIPHGAREFGGGEPDVCDDHGHRAAQPATAEPSDVERAMEEYRKRCDCAGPLPNGMNHEPWCVSSDIDWCSQDPPCGISQRHTHPEPPR